MKVKSLADLAIVAPVEKIPHGASEEPPREMTPADRRWIFRSLDEVYDDANGCYVDNMTDHLLAQSLDVPRKWVADIREENFGPDGSNDAMSKLLSNLMSLHRDATKAEEQALAAAEVAEAAKTAVKGALEDLKAIQKAVGPRAG